MKKKVFGRKLSRERDSRRALFRSLALSLLEHGKITTTRAKALAVVPFVEKIVKKVIANDTIANRRLVTRLLMGKNQVVNVLFESVNRNFSVKGRFTSIVPLPNRKGDAARMVTLKLLEGLFAKVPEGKEKGKGKTSKKVIAEAASKKVLKTNKK